MYSEIIGWFKNSKFYNINYSNLVKTDIKSKLNGKKDQNYLQNFIWD